MQDIPWLFVLSSNKVSKYLKTTVLDLDSTLQNLQNNLIRVECGRWNKQGNY